MSRTGRPPAAAAGAGAPQADARARRLAEALRTNLRRRKGATRPPEEDDGADGGEALYASSRGATNGG